MRESLLDDIKQVLDGILVREVWAPPGHELGGVDHEHRICVD